jgi:hypothetical protein
MRPKGWVAGLFAWLTFSSLSLGADAPAGVASTGSCITLNATALATLRLAQAEPKKPADSKAAAVPPPAVRRPMTDRELRLLITVLSAIEWDGPKDGARAAGTPNTRARSPNERLPIALDRLGVLLLDSSAILARTQLEETLKDLRGLPTPDLGQIRWGESALVGLDTCLRGRYAEFGGEPAFRQVTQLVLQNRATLERLISGPNLASRAPPVPAVPAESPKP